MSNKRARLFAMAVEVVTLAQQQAREDVFFRKVPLDSTSIIGFSKIHRLSGEKVATREMEISIGELIHFDTKIEDLAEKFLRTVMNGYFDYNGNEIDGFENEKAVQDQIEKEKPTLN